MRPSFSYLDRADQKIKTDVGPVGDGGQLLFSKFLEMLNLWLLSFLGFHEHPLPTNLHPQQIINTSLIHYLYSQVTP